MSISSTDESIEIIFVKFLCESITAFGFPVVPDVKISEATALDSTLGGSRARRLASSTSSGISKTSSKVQTSGFWILDFGFWIEAPPVLGGVAAASAVFFSPPVLGGVAAASADGVVALGADASANRSRNRG